MTSRRAHWHSGPGTEAVRDGYKPASSANAAAEPANGLAHPPPGNCACRAAASVTGMVQVAMGAILLIAAVGCGAASTTAATVPPGLEFDVRTALRDAVTEVLQLESAAFTLEHLKGTTALIPGFLEMTRVSGEVDIPDKFRLKVEAVMLIPRSFVEIGVITIGDQAYMTNPITKEWRQVEPSALPFTLSDISRTLAGIIEAVDEPTLVGLERLGDRDTHHIQGSILSQDLAELVPGAGEGFDVRLGLWLATPGNLLLQVLISGMVVPTDEPDTVRRLTLDDINVPVDISPPK